jgi:hypothetical protein
MPDRHKEARQLLEVYIQAVDEHAAAAKIMAKLDGSDGGEFARAFSDTERAWEKARLAHEALEVFLKGIDGEILSAGLRHRRFRPF